MTIKIRHTKIDQLIGVDDRVESGCELVLDLILTRELLEESVNSYFSALKLEIFFLLDHLPLLNLDDFVNLLRSYILSDGPRLNLPNRFEVKSFDLGIVLDTDAEFYFKRQFSDRISVEEEQPNFGRVDLVFENKEFGLYRLRIAPGHSIPPHFHAKTNETELVLSSGLLLQGQQVSKGTCISWGKNFIHSYENKSEQWQIVLCIDCPAFDHSDEVQVGEKVKLESPPKAWKSIYETLRGP